MINIKFEAFSAKANVWEDLTKYLVFSVKNGFQLDEQLDECFLTLFACPYIFQPNTLTRLTITLKTAAKYANSSITTKLQERKGIDVTTEYNNDKTVKQYVTLHYIVANDSVFRQPIFTKDKNGKELYKHDLHLIEATKLLEGFIGDNLSFTNSLGDSFNTQAFSTVNETEQINGTLIHRTYTCTFKSTIFKALQTKQITLPTIDQIFNHGHGDFRLVGDSPDYNPDYDSAGLVGGDFNKFLSLKNATSGNEVTGATADGRETTVSYEGIYKATYQMGVQFSMGGETYVSEIVLVYTFAVVNTTTILPLKPYSIANVITRLFDLAEPLTIANRAPRFQLKQSTADKLGEIIAPEFTFTKETLREQLQQVGGYIHGEPRIVDIIPDNRTPDGFQYIVDFDFYGDNTPSYISQQPLVTKCIGTSINDYHTGLDSSADNLINVIDFEQGVESMPEPTDNKGITLRSETVYARLEEDNNSVIPTERPIYQVASNRGVLVVGIPYYDNGVIKYRRDTDNYGWDITPYLYENTDYTNLSSYDEVYPYSKSYAIYYTQGEKNIRGLFFHVPEATGYIIKEYSILNILKAVVGENDSRVTYLQNHPELYPYIEFQVNYIPIMSERILTSKSLVTGGFPRTLAYNQGANGIEARYYGEHLKGVSARLGNVERTETYILAFLSDIPKIGTKYDNDYYISAVTVEYFPTYILCTVGLSKHFNRLSNYIGINTQKRMWEISEKQITDRQSAIKTYCLITVSDRGAKPQDDPNGILWAAPLQLYFNFTGLDYHDFVCIVEPKDFSGNYILDYAIQKSFVSTAYGNSIVVSFSMEDNYSAGQKATVNASADTAVKGVWGQGVPYTDYYGRAYYLGIVFKTWGNQAEQTAFADGLSYPQCNAQGATETFSVAANDYTQTAFCGVQKLVYQKDSRERVSVSLSYEAVTTDERIIIGSALARHSRIVNPKAVYGLSKQSVLGDTADIELRYYETELNSISQQAPSSNGALSGYKVGTLTGVNFTNNSITLPSISGYKAWAFVTKLTSEQKHYAGERVTVYKGGEILLGGNFNPSGKTIYFTKKNRLDRVFPTKNDNIFR